MKLVLNADDFGFDDDTVDATIACFGRGELTSATIMAGMPASERAVKWALEHPEHSYGLHLQLVGDGSERPLSAPGDVPALVTTDGTFPGTTSVRVRALLGRLPVDQLEHEIERQILWLRERGLSVSHVDSHRHLHKFRPVRAALQRVLPRLGIHRVRTVQDVYLRRPPASPTYWLGSRWKTRADGPFASTDHFYMPASAGDTDWRALLGRLPHLTGDTLEIGVHPGNTEEWRAVERDALGAFVGEARPVHEFVSWHAVG